MTSASRIMISHVDYNKILFLSAPNESFNERLSKNQVGSNFKIVKCNQITTPDDITKNRLVSLEFLK